MLAFVVLIFFGGAIALHQGEALTFEEGGVKPVINKEKLAEIKEVRYEFND